MSTTVEQSVPDIHKILRRHFTSHTRVISPTCLSTGGAVVVQIKWETKMSAFQCTGFVGICFVS